MSELIQCFSGSVVGREEGGSPNGLKDRTFRATFEMPVTKYNHNLTKVFKRRYRNPIFLANEWRRLLDCGECSSLAALARYLQVSRARVTQIMNLLKLSSDAIALISSLGDPVDSLILTERRLRPLLFMPAQEQIEHIQIMLSK